MDKNQTQNFNMEKILVPKNDVVFSALFTRGKENITKALLEDILNIKINKLELDKSKDLLNDSIRSKNGRLDLRATINENMECDIEVQLCSHKRVLERFLYYWAKIYASNLDIGEKYHKLRKTISIIIIDDKIPEFKEILKAHTKWQIREEDYKEKILTPFLEIDIIELPKAIKEYQGNKENEVLQWMMFFENPEDLEVRKIMEENEDIKRAKEEYDKLREQRNLYLDAVREKMARMDQEQLLYEAKIDGLEEGRKVGKEEGKKEVEKQAKEEKIKMAKKMLEKGNTIEDIIEITGLTKEEISQS